MYEVIALDRTELDWSGVNNAEHPHLNMVIQKLRLEYARYQNCFSLGLIHNPVRSIEFSLVQKHSSLIEDLSLKPLLQGIDWLQILKLEEDCPGFI